MVTHLFDKAMARILPRAGRPAKVIAALSGGMDSTVLLHLLAAWRRNSPECAVLTAAHLNHGLRGAAARMDQEFSRGLAMAAGIPFATECVNVEKLAKEERLGLEEAGRMARYRFFRDLAGGEALILTGHHADDQTETILMNLRRGAHRRGMAGMNEYSVLTVSPGLTVKVGRPLLGIGREHLHAYALEHSLDWREDASNLDLSFARNRVRHRIIPLLEKIMPGFKDRLLAKAREAGIEEEALVRRGMDMAAALARRENGGLFFPVEPEAFTNPERLNYALRHLVEEETGGRLSGGAVLSRLTRLAEAGRLGEGFSLPGRLMVRRERDGLFFFRADGEPDEPHGGLILPDPPFDVRTGGLRVTAGWLPTTGKPPAEDAENPKIEWMNPAFIRWPLCIRPPRPGERFHPLGAPGSRKIQDILVDLKCPRRKRGMPRVLADNAGALWLWPYRLADRAGLTGALARALRVGITEEA